MKNPYVERRIEELWQNGYSHELEWFGRKSAKRLADGCVIGAVLLYILGNLIDFHLSKKGDY